MNEKFPLNISKIKERFLIIETVLAIVLAACSAQPADLSKANSFGDSSSSNETLPLTAVLDGTQTNIPSSVLAIDTIDNYGVSMLLEEVRELDDGFVLIGSLHWNLDQNYGGLHWMDYVNVKDANGKTVAFEEVYSDPSYWGYDGQAVLWAYKITGKNQAWPLTLSIKPSVTLS